MGVRGLTSYIARHAEQFLVPYELHDCNLVIDGDNIACNLYKDVTGTYSAFGGDYDDFYRSVVEFFHVLAECNIRAYVLMDGGYEERKLRTVSQRLRGKIAVIKRINPCGSATIFPLMMKEVFVDAVRSCGVPIMRCIFEADEELAALSRKLRCPVLSYDSDFYIHNVRYIPLVTLTMKAHTKRLKDHDDVSAQPTSLPSGRKLRKNEARYVEKRSKANRIMSRIEVNAQEKRAPKYGKTYKYLDCCLYRIEHLIARKSLSKEKLPLFAALLGNDYITRSSFRNFFEISLRRGGPARKMKVQQKRIRQIMLWLREHSLEVALEKVLGRLKKAQRESLLEQVQAATSGYSNEKCCSYDYFRVKYPDQMAEAEKQHSAEEEEDEDNDYEQYDEEDEEGVCTTESEEEPEVQELVESEEEDNPDEEPDPAEDALKDTDEQNDADAEGCESDTDTSDSGLPEWFLEKLYPARLPRFMVDLMHIKKYINSPQIEHFPFEDCNQIALPILIYTFTLLNVAEGRVGQAEEDGHVLPTEFTYLTRTTRVTNVHYVRCRMSDPPKCAFDPRAPNPQLIRGIFENRQWKGLNVGKLFEKLELLPKDLRLYMLAIVYWMQRSQHCDLIHLHALIVCLVTIRTIDAKIPAERDLKTFEKKFGKIIQREQTIRQKETLQGIKRGIRKDLMDLTVPQRIEHITKSDCLLVQEKLLKHFHMQEIFKKKYDLYSSQVLHAFAEFQCVVFQLHALNVLLDGPYESPRMGQLFCGVFIYNLYDLLRQRLDLRYHVENFIFRDSQMMFDFYNYLIDWCEEFIPSVKIVKVEQIERSASKKVLKKQRQRARKEAAIVKDLPEADPYRDCCSDEIADSDFFDLNNKFCAFLKVN